MAPTFEQATKQLEPFVRLGKLNTDREPAIATRFRIQGIPTVMILQAGREIDRRAGVMDLDTLIRWIQSHIR
jgi:thioredoxin 2